MSTDTQSALSAEVNDDANLDIEHTSDAVLKGGIREDVFADIERILPENNVGEDEFTLEDIKVYGSYATGKNKKTSDIDFIVQYSGSMREDDAFNMLNSEKLTITDNNGVERKVDINPINREISGTIEDILGERYYQSENNIRNKNQTNLTQEDRTNIQKFKEFVGKVFGNKLTRKKKQTIRNR